MIGIVNEVEPLLTSLGNFAKASCIQEGHYFKNNFGRKRLEIAGHRSASNGTVAGYFSAFYTLLTSKLDEIG